MPGADSTDDQTTHPMNLLPLEIKMHILQYLEPIDVYNMLFVCKAFNEFASDQSYWWRACMEKWFEKDCVPKQMSKKDRKVDWKGKFIKMNGFKRPVMIKEPKQVKEK